MLRSWNFAMTVALIALLGLNAKAQSTITIHVRDVPLSTALDLISDESALQFSYNPRRIDAKQKVSIDAADRPLKEVLDELGKLAEFEYSFVEDQIVLKKSHPEKEELATVSGFVKDEKTGEPLIGATVIIRELNTGVATNAFGFFSITAPKDVYELSCTYIGYKPQLKRVDVTQDATIDLKLPEEPPVLPELLVYDVATSFVGSLHPSQTNLRPNTVRERPGFFGEVDVIKSLEAIPGVKMHSDGSTFYYVRGGNRDQNLVLVDDAAIYNPSHLLGLFSTIIPDAVNDINLYSGDIPASMGGRLSSVLDVRTKKGNDQRMEIWGNAGLISTKAGIEGPFRKDNSSYLLSTRISRLKWLTNLGNNDVTEFQFYDVTGKMNFNLNQRNRIFFSFYSGQDGYLTSSNGIRWSNQAGTFKWNSVINDKMFVNTTLAASGYDYFLYTSVANNTRWNSHIANVGLKADFSYFVRPGSEMNFGASLTGYNFNPGNFEVSPAQPSPHVSSVRNSSELVLYWSHDHEFNSRWSVNYGLRLSAWGNTGKSFEFVFDQTGRAIDTLYFERGETYSKYKNVEPRLSVRYLTGDNSSIKASYSRNVQNLHLLSNSTSPFTSLEVWLPSNINIKPQYANQLTLGYYRTFPAAGVSAMAEGFYKRMGRLIDYTPHAEMLLNPLIESELLFGNGLAYGIELQAKKTEGRVRGVTGYSYARSKRTFSAINAGKTFNAFSDRPHQFNITVSYDLTERWALGMDWNYSTGAPFSSPVGFYFYNGMEIPVFGSKNNDRLPDYHRLDVAGTFRLNRNVERRFRHSLTFSIYNLYGRKNALFFNYNKVVASDGSLKVPGNLLDADQVISKYYLFRFTPSLTYNFRW